MRKKGKKRQKKAKKGKKKQKMTKNAIICFLIIKDYASA